MQHIADVGKGPDQKAVASDPPLYRVEVAFQ